MNPICSTGFFSPLGVSIQGEALNFAVFSPKEKPKLLFYEPSDLHAPIWEADLLQEEKGVWSIQIQNLSPNWLYAYQIPSLNLPLVDPYAQEVFSPKEWGQRKKDIPYFRMAYLPRKRFFDWEGISSPTLPYKDLIFYEMHVRGFTQDPSSKVKYPGTFLGIKEKIPYLKKLGVTAIELQPILEFDETQSHQKLGNFWGYSPLHFFSLMRRYAVHDPILELCELVKELHKNQIKIILDVVYNHTGEDLPFHCKGFSQENYYLLHQGKDTNYTGCGNTFSCNNPWSRDLIVASLKYLVETFHIDGFRFDLASLFFRGEKGEVLSDPPILDRLQKEPAFTHTLFIAEPWDAAGLYQVGTFAKKYHWMEWNGTFRDQVRSFWHPEITGNLEEAFLGSPSLYQSSWQSVNFVTCHDGFCLQDLVSFTQKHNEENGEKNQDGNPHNLSYNFGHEGYTQDPQINALREKQIKNFWITLLFSKGIPLILMGDEHLHQKRGNNNTWCHDHAINWFSWEKENHWMEKQLILRKRLSFLQEVPFILKKNSALSLIVEAKTQYACYLFLFNPGNRLQRISLEARYSWKILTSSSEKTHVEKQKLEIEAHTCLLLEGLL